MVFKRELEKQIAELAQKNTELKRRLDNLFNSDCWASEKLSKAKEIIALGLRVCETSSIEYMNLYQKQAEQFLNDSKQEEQYATKR